jgi:tetratricopeptide (TPR) repeat protein
VSDPSKMLIAVRQDGLGPRLSALANTVRLAKGLEWEHGFIWPARAGVPAAEVLFEPEYLADRLVLDYEPVDFAALPPGALRDKTLDDVTADPRFRGIAISRWDVPIGFALKKQIKLRGAPRDALYGLPLAPAVRTAMEATAGALMPDTVALEVWRARTLADFVPAEILRHSLAELIAAGRTVVLVGDDAALIAEFREAFGVQAVADLAGTDDPDLLAMANLAALMRCAEAIGAPSDMARAAKPMAGTEPRRAGEDLTKDQAIALLRAGSGGPDTSDRAAPTQFFLAGLLDEGSAERLAAIAEAHRLDPENPFYARAMVRPLIEQGRYDEAETLTRETAERAFDGSGKRETGMAALFNDGDRKAEATALETACAAFEGPYLHAQLSAVLHDLQSYERAYAAARKAFALDPDSALLALRLGEQAFRARHHQIAHKAFAQAVIDAPDSALAHAGLADTELALNNPNQAYKSMAQAVRLAPNHGYYLARLAYMEEMRGRRDEADTLILRATSAAPGEADVLSIVSRIYESRKDFGQAMRTLQSVDSSTKEVRGMRNREKVLRRAIRDVTVRETKGDKAPKLPHEVDLSRPKKTTMIVAVQDALSKWWTAGKR